MLRQMNTVEEDVSKLFFRNYVELRIYKRIKLKCYLEKSSLIMTLVYTLNEDVYHRRLKSITNIIY